MSTSTDHPRRSSTLADSVHEAVSFLMNPPWAGRANEAGICDFTFGNPHEMPLSAYVDTLRDWLTPLHPGWFAYTTSATPAREAAAAALRSRTGLPFSPDDIAMTNGGMAAISMGLKTVADPGDEAIVSRPAWFNYDPIILEAGLQPVGVRLAAETFDLDLDAIAAAITPRTRVVIVNTPHNPTGVIYSAKTLRGLARLLEETSARHGRRIWVLADEVYARLVFDGHAALSPAVHYPWTLIAYSYAKVLLTPGQRLGYLALPPSLPKLDAWRERVLAVQIASGWAFPNAVLQHATPDLEPLSTSLEHLQRKRDRLLGALRGIGYAAHAPAGAFYLLPASPWTDDVAFAGLLAERGVLVMPGTLLDAPSYIRISLTANDDAIERAIPRFAAAWQAAQSTEIPALAAS